MMSIAFNKLSIEFLIWHYINLIYAENCYPQNKCDSGYMDKTNGQSYWWACGEHCIGGKYYTDIYCNCACIEEAKCSITSTQTTNCNLSIVDLGEDVDCTIYIDYDPAYQDENRRSSVILNIFNFTDSTTYCDEPRIRYTHLNYNQGQIWLYEGEPAPDNRFKICSGNSASVNHNCSDTNQCLNNYFLTNYYQNSSFIDISTFISKYVEEDCDSNHSELTLTCQRAQKVVCSRTHSCHDMEIEVADGVAIYLQCHAQYSCSKIEIYALNATHITVECFGDNSCFNLTINGRYADQFTMYCHNGQNEAVCDNLYIDIEYVETVNIVCAQFGCANIDINAVYSGNTVVHAQGFNAFINCSIYSRESQHLSLSCVAQSLDERSCWNSHIYLSSNPNSNTLVCRFGCTRMHLYFKQDIDVLLFADILFEECALCESVEQCIDEWIIYYNNYDYSVIYTGQQDIHLLSEFAEYIADKHECVGESMLQNTTIDLVEIILFLLCLLILLPFLIVMLNHFRVIINQKISHKYISKKPKLWILLYAICVDIICYIAYVCWGIKLTVLNKAFVKYCFSKYQFEQDENYCNQDRICVDVSSEDTYECGFYNDHIFMVYWVLFGFYCLYELVSFRLCVTYCDVLKCKTYHTLITNQDLFDAKYGKREMWMSHKFIWTHKDYPLLPGYLKFCTSIFIRYGIINILMWKVVTSTDYDIKWYDFYAIFALICIKILLQIGYSCGDQYSSNQDVELILQHAFGKHIALIIKIYTPRFYNKSLCLNESGRLISKILTDEVELNELNKTTEQNDELTT